MSSIILIALIAVNSSVFSGYLFKIINSALFVVSSRFHSLPGA